MGKEAVERRTVGALERQRDIPTLVKDSSLVEERRRRLVEAAVGVFVRKGYHATTTREIAREAGFSVGAVYEKGKWKGEVLYLVGDAIHREVEERLAGAVGLGDDDDAGKPRRQDARATSEGDGSGREGDVVGVGDSRLRGNDKGGGKVRRQDACATKSQKGRRDAGATGGDDNRRDAASTLGSAITSYFEVCDEMQDSILLIYRETASLARESQPYVLEAEKRIAGIFAEILKRGQKAGAFSFANARALELMAHNIVVLGHMWAFRRWFLREKFSLKEYTKQQVSVILGEVRND